MTQLIKQQPLLRIADILLSITGIICGLPIILAIYIAGLFDTGSPFFFNNALVKIRNFLP
jgi:lipopolysaccharide/colanic/teichoic acid biosynthesis glycosyltransferase